MKELFSLKFALDNKIQILKLASMPVEQYLELNFDKGIYKPPCTWIINNIEYFLQLTEDTLDPDLNCFTFVDGIESFGDYLITELDFAINKVKHLK